MSEPTLPEGWRVERVSPELSAITRFHHYYEALIGEETRVVVWPDGTVSADVWTHDGATAADLRAVLAHLEARMKEGE